MINLKDIIKFANQYYKLALLSQQDAKEILSDKSNKNNKDSLRDSKESTLRDSKESTGDKDLDNFLASLDIEYPNYKSKENQTTENIFNHKLSNPYSWARTKY